jgi:hypothetical protein
MSVSKQTIDLAQVEKCSASLVCVTELSLEDMESDTIFTEFDVYTPMDFGDPEWDDDDLSHENFRRPPLRRKYSEYLPLV